MGLCSARGVCSGLCALLFRFYCVYADAFTVLFLMWFVLCLVIELACFGRFGFVLLFWVYCGFVGDCLIVLLAVLTCLLW